MPEFSVLDAIIVIPVLIAAFKGLQNGLIKEAFGLAGIILALFLAFEYMATVEKWLGNYLDANQYFMPVLAAALIFIVTLTIANLAAWLLRKLVQAVQLGSIDRVLGAVFGALKLGLLLSVIFLLLAGFNMPGKETRDRSVAYPYVIQLAPATFNTIALVYPGAKKFDETLQETVQEYNPLSDFY